MKKGVSLLLLVFLYMNNYAQDGGATKITVFQPGGLNADNTPKTPPLTSLVKWNYSLLTRGVFLMNYEFRLADKFTGEVGGGLTYRDFIYEVMKNDSLQDYKGPKVNFGVEGALRYYPKGHRNFEGFYLSPGLSYRKYSFNPQTELYGNGNYGGYKNTFYPGYHFTDVQFKFGYQYESWWIDDVITDFYIGFGYRNATAKYYELSPVNNGTLLTPVTKKESYPQILLGFKLGMAF